MTFKNIFLKNFCQSHIVCSANAIKTHWFNQNCASVPYREIGLLNIKYRALDYLIFFFKIWDNNQLMIDCIKTNSMALSLVVLNLTCLTKIELLIIFYEQAWRCIWYVANRMKRNNGNNVWNTKNISLKRSELTVWLAFLSETIQINVCELKCSSCY